jgi:predicted Zn-dependent protease
MSLSDVLQNQRKEMEGEFDVALQQWDMVNQIAQGGVGSLFDGRPEKAYEQLKQAHNEAQKCFRAWRTWLYHSEGFILSLVGEMALAAGRPEEAEEMLEKAQSLLKKKG